MTTEQYSDILLDSVPEVTQVNYTYRQSANVLFNFMPKLEYLKSKLSKKALIPRFYEENIAYLDLSHMDKVAFPMVCFCDIHLNKLTYHMGGSIRYDSTPTKTVNSSVDIVTEQIRFYSRSCPKARTRTCTDCRNGQEHSPITD